MEARLFSFAHQRKKKTPRDSYNIVVYLKLTQKNIKHRKSTKVAGKSTNIWLVNKLESIEQKESPRHEIAKTSTHAKKLQKWNTMETLVNLCK